ncbi:MAG: SIS domain-containing protein, partial [Thermodesulfovibrionia bacterium]|nr:SIS domain-containing protein [Thermodesulfovibrionia bacterium]
MGIIKKAKQVFDIEIEALKKVRKNINSDFEKAVRMIHECKGKVIVTGIGKSGLIGRKIAATLSSTGTLAVFLHPAEGMHGDLGIVTKR